MSDSENCLTREHPRAADILRLLPRGRGSVLDIGARDGFFSELLTEYFETVTALDLRMPSFSYPRVTNVAGDATRLQFPDSSFDCVFCAEVLEHIPALEDACREIARVARHEIVIGVPYKQDIRVGRTTCQQCRKPNPPFGHVNRFDEKRLTGLFPGLSVSSLSFVGSTRSVTNRVSTMLMDMAGHPWGTYGQIEPCIYCGAKLIAPNRRSILSRVYSGVAIRINRVQELFARPHGNWINVVFSKDGHR
jgi:SAM-dependent methyltransferase